MHFVNLYYPKTNIAWPTANVTEWELRAVSLFAPSYLLLFAFPLTFHRPPFATLKRILQLTPNIYTAIIQNNTPS